MENQNSVLNTNIWFLKNHWLCPDKFFIFWEAIQWPTRNIWKIIGYKKDSKIRKKSIYFATDSLWNTLIELGTLKEIQQFFKNKIFEFVE
jgi:hypothetical protein